MSFQSLLTNTFSFLFLPPVVHCRRDWTVCPVVARLLDLAVCVPEVCFNMFLCPSVSPVNTEVDQEA